MVGLLWHAEEYSAAVLLEALEFLED